MYSYENKPSFKKLLKKIFKRNKKLYEQILKKIEEIINTYNIEHYKNLRHDLKDFKRVQIGHFVLIFKFIKSRNKIIFEDFDHHDKIYKKNYR